MRNKLFSVVIIMVLISMAISACAPAATAVPTQAAATKPAATQVPAKVWKVAVLLPGVITDADYNTLGYLGLMELKGQGMQTAYSENVAVPDIDRAMREYIDQGYNIIWTHGSQFVTQTVTLAKAMPNVVFVAEADAPVTDPPANLWVIDRNFHLGYYAMGVLAAKATKTGKIGYLSGQTLPFSYAELHAMQQAIADLGAKVELKYVWAGDFNDPSKGRQLADAFLSEGVDVIVCSLNLGIFGVFEAAKAKDPEGGKILVTAKYIDKTNFAPKNYITSVLYDFAGPIKDIVSKVKGGQTGGYYPLGFETGVAVQLPLKNVSAELNNQIKQVQDDIKSGKIKVVKDVTAIK